MIIKKTISIVSLLFLLSILLCCAEDWKTTDGKIYKSVKVVKQDADSVTILDSDGGARIEFSKLPTDLQKRFNYDPNKTPPTPAAQTNEEPSVETTITKADLLDGLDKSSKLYQMLAGTGAKYSYDKFKEQADLQSKEFDLGNGLQITFYLNNTKKTLYKQDSYYVIITSESDDWRFPHGSDVDFKADSVLDRKTRYRR